MSRQWRQGPLNCCGDCGICCCGTFCQPCLVNRNANGLGKSGWLYCLVFLICPCIPVYLLRDRAREQYNIEGDTCGDLMCASCCGPCVTCQTAVEIKSHCDQD